MRKNMDWAPGSDVRVLGVERDGDCWVVGPEVGSCRTNGRRNCVGKGSFTPHRSYSGARRDGEDRITATSRCSRIVRGYRRHWRMTASANWRHGAMSRVDVKRTYANCASRPIQLASIGRARDMAELTGSALLALAVARGFLSAEAAWQAAHVDENFQAECGGRGAAGSALARVRGGGARGRSRPRALHLDFASQSQALSTQNSQENMVFVVNNTWQKRCC
jgi:hypothetical protein